MHSYITFRDTLNYLGLSLGDSKLKMLTFNLWPQLTQKKLMSPVTLNVLKHDVKRGFKLTSLNLSGSNEIKYV
jgi:hypothetical protein